ncbi:MarR family winged helix-turn-helix transcriptional regulator [Glycomyces dulcitolivorans]|uniref:MarR family winged helix-turn-helix transcriptional regulator n=1 Tax=Glycomyces dulcitolivorans TaxID=2200759 RepID=UPI000DD39213|nr:MarR family winged helix-turn-helix transcriptional regulator [Glycomyces dulcitolivorans]
MTQSGDGVRWLTDLVRLEIVLWDRVDARLKADHELPLPYFEALHMFAPDPDASLRIGDLAGRLRISVGGASKLADRVVASGLLRRDPDPDDRRASRVALTPEGRAILAAASESYEDEVDRLLGTALDEADRRHMHALVVRLLASASEDAG